MATETNGEPPASTSRIEYYPLLNLYREPFSNSPDPGLFFRSARHTECLQKLELAIRLRRGLNIVRGEIGAGKTTLCRHLIQLLAEEPLFDVHLLLDPAFDDEAELLHVLLREIVGETPSPDSPPSIARSKERIKQHLFRRGVDEDRTIVLIVDEAQKLTPQAVEVLRELLNYETSEHKLLQIVLFGQLELDEVLERHPNFADRANLVYTLEPMDAEDVGAYIRFRLEQSELPGRDRPGIRFTAGAIRRIATLTGGYPRKINHLGHNLLLLLVVRGEYRVTAGMVDTVAGRYRWGSVASFRRHWVVAGSLVVLLILAGVTAWLRPFSLALPPVVSEAGPGLAPARAPEPARASNPARAPEPAPAGVAPPVPSLVSASITEPASASASDAGTVQPRVDPPPNPPGTPVSRPDTADERAEGSPRPSDDPVPQIAAAAPPASVGPDVGPQEAETQDPNVPETDSRDGAPQETGLPDGRPNHADLPESATPGADPLESVTRDLESQDFVTRDAGADWLWPLGEGGRLGAVTFQLPDSVSEMASRIFGRSSHRLMQAIVRENPGIPDLDRIQLGDRIEVPLLQVVAAGGVGRFWIERGRFRDLDTAYQVARVEGPESLRVLPSLSGSGVLEFRVVQRGPMETRRDAERRLAATPDPVRDRFRIAEFASTDWLVIER